jgi:uncharacterized membrane protein YfcA
MAPFRLSRKYQAILLALAIMAVATLLGWLWPLPTPRFLLAGPAIVLLWLSFASGYVDSSLGMGYGLTLTPILLILGYRPLDVVPAVLVSQIGNNIFASVAHHTIGNVDLRPGGRAFWITLTIAASSIIGTIGAALLALRMPETILEAWIGILVFIIGVITLASYGRHLEFSWKKIFALGLLAGFNKGTTGGGYGPIITGGQLLCGVAAANAVAITQLAETFACFAGTGAFLLGSDGFSWQLAPFMAVGAIAAVPFSALTVRVLRPTQLKISVGVLTSALGILLLLKLFVY